MMRSSDVRGRSISRMLVGCVLALALAHPVRAEESPAPLSARSEAGDDSAALGLLRERAIERRKELEEMEPIPALVRRGTIDKGAIAAEVRAGMKTLEELGNPHIPEGFLLKKAEDDPDRQVDGDARSAHCARMLRTRRLKPREAYDALYRSPPARDTAVARRAVSPPESRSGASFGGIVLGIAGLAVGFVLLRRRADSDPAQRRKNRPRR